MYVDCIVRSFLYIYLCPIVSGGAVRRGKAEKEAALLFIAFADGLKLYPAILGVLYLAEKRYREAGRLVVYGVVLFFLPFGFLGSGWIFLRNISAVGSGTQASR